MKRVAKLVALASVGAMPGLASGQSAPRTGEEVFQRMHDAYAGKWYRTLTFVQKTTRYRADGTSNVSTWYESLEQVAPGLTRLRIDTGDPSAGNGILYTADSTWRITNGKVTATQGSGNEFLPLIEGVYMQPVGRTVAQIAGTGVNLQRVITGGWEGRPAWIIGASSAADTTSPQIWIDTARNVVVRMVLVPAPGTPTLDIRLDGYEPLAGGWLATRIAMSAGGKPLQTEEYSEWKANVDLPESLFDPATWTTAPHWANGRKS